MCRKRTKTRHQYVQELAGYPKARQPEVRGLHEKINWETGIKNESVSIIFRRSWDLNLNREANIAWMKISVCSCNDGAGTQWEKNGLHE